MSPDGSASAEPKACLREDGADELSLPGGVGADVRRVLIREASLDRFVLRRERGILPKSVAEGEPLAPEVAARLREMEAVCHRARLCRRLREVMRDAWSVRRVYVRKCLQRFKGRPRLAEIAHPRHHVDDRFGGHARDRSRPDVVDATLEPRSEHPFEQRPLGLEEPAPARVVRNDSNRTAAHGVTVSVQQRPNGDEPRLRECPAMSPELERETLELRADARYGSFVLDAQRSGPVKRHLAHPVGVDVP
jgi:hypothetical protein